VAQVILSVKYLAMPSAAAARTAVNGFVRYIQYRDHHADVVADTSRMIRYVGYRDPTSARGQLFDMSSRAGDLERKALVAHVRRSLRELSPSDRPQRAVYRFVLSPADARGLDLRELARATMRGLERDAGPLPPWVAAVHRNTRHPHVHIVMAARHEVSPDRFRTLVITRPRLARMKESLALEMSRQVDRSPSHHTGRTSSLYELVRVKGNLEAIPHFASLRGRRRPGFRGRTGALDALGSRLRQAARRYQRQIEQELLEDERRQNLERGWER
jgi:MobA/VirD2-like, nuclease domain